MEEYCKNCGAKIKNNAKFCQDCGSPIENAEETETLKTEDQVETGSKDKNFCPNCGRELTEEEEFCQDCGTDINNPQIATPEPQEKSFFEKNKIPIIIIGVVAVVVLFLLLMASMPQESESYNYDFGTQTVNVDGVSFVIPGNYRLNPSSIDYDYNNYVMSYVQEYTNGEDTITIGILDSSYDVDAQAVNDETGGVKKTMYGYEGYYNELSDGYSFNFAVGNKLCMLGVSSPYVFDQIDVLG
nr:zinc ribbon domain-containing protein [uncultured Methanobrevibacter sp.]